jgi:hypothetical protein
MTQIDLGKIKPIWKGDWATGTAYEKNDMVKHGANSYIATAAHTAGATFAGDSASWDTMATGADIPSQSGQSGKALTTDGSTLSWGDGGGILRTWHGRETAANTYRTGNTYEFTSMAQTLTPKAADSSFYVSWNVNCAPDNHDANAVFNIHDSLRGSNANNDHLFAYTSQWTPTTVVNQGYANMFAFGAIASPDDYASWMINFGGIYTPPYQNTNTRTFTCVVRTHRATASNGINLNYNQQDHPHASSGVCHWTIMEIANGAVS